AVDCTPTQQPHHAARSPSPERPVTMPKSSATMRRTTRSRWTGMTGHVRRNTQLRRVALRARAMRRGVLAKAGVVVVADLRVRRRPSVRSILRSGLPNMERSGHRRAVAEAAAQARSSC
ncbi:MAG: hypothetical protein ACK5X3_01765, partial [Pseudomonadota bacterium]